jgi:hypothetical protein
MGEAAPFHHVNVKHRDGRVNRNPDRQTSFSRVAWAQLEAELPWAHSQPGAWERELNPYLTLGGQDPLDAPVQPFLGNSLAPGDSD